MEENNIIIDVCGKRTLEYVIDCLAKFNRGIETLTLRAIGGSISKGVEIAKILQKEFGITISDNKIETFPIRINGDDAYIFDASCLKIVLKRSYQKTNSLATEYNFPKNKFIDFPIYHLLLDWHLSRSKKLQLLSYDNTPLITVVDKDGAIKCQKNFPKKYEEKFSSGIGAALYRCGLLLPKNWQLIAKKLSEFDDIILGIDTNILYNCTLSEHLIPALSIIDPKEYIHTPNWILFVIPSAVMHEIEEAANIRSNGYLQVAGRIGFRALQEIMELSQSTDIPGVSLIIVGEANPVLDTRVEIQGLREDFCKREIQKEPEKQEEKDIAEEKKILPIYRSFKTSSGDMIIRDQFKQFLRQISFHKGTYFLTADKSNKALASTEGLHPIYFPFPFEYYQYNDEVNVFKMSTKNGERIKMKVPVGKLIYEMAVQFGSVKIKWNDKEIKLGCDAKGEKLDYWICRSLRIEREDFNKLLSRDYSGMFGLNDILKVWDRLTRSFIGFEEI